MSTTDVSTNSAETPLTPADALQLLNSALNHIEQAGIRTWQGDREDRRAVLIVVEGVITEPHGRTIVLAGK